MNSVLARGPLAVQHAHHRVEHLVHVQDRVVVHVDVGAAELRARLVVGVLVHVHQVQVEEPALAAVDAQELGRRLDHVHVGAALEQRRVARAAAPAGRRAQTDAYRRRSPGRSRNSPRPSRCARCRRCGIRRRGIPRPRCALRAGARRRSASRRSVAGAGRSRATPSSTSSTTTGSCGGRSARPGRRGNRGTGWSDAHSRRFAGAVRAACRSG